MSTLTVSNFVRSVSEDIEQLSAAFSGWGINEKLIASILTHKNDDQCKTIGETYTSTYSEDLLKEFDRKLSSDFEIQIDIIP